MNMSSLSPGRFWKRFAGGGKHVEPGDLSQRLAHVIAGARDVTDAATAVAEILGWKLQPTRLFIIVRQGEAWRYAADYAAASQPSRDREVSVLSAEEQTRLVSLLGSPLQPTAEMPLTGESAVLWPADLNVPAIHSALLTPLAIDSELMGAVVTCYAGTDRPQSQTAVLLDAMAPILAIGLHHAELIEHKRLVGEHEALAASVTSAIRTATGVDAIVNAAVAGLGGALNARKTTIFVEAGEETIRRDQPGVAMRARAEYPAVESGGSLIGTLLELGEESTLGRLLAGEMLTVPEGGANNPILADPTHSTAATAHLLAPIVHLKHLAGVLAIEQIDGALKFSDKELALIGLVSEETGIALYQDGLNREARETEWREASIGGITAAIHNSLDLDTVLQTVVNELGQGLSVCRCALALVEDPISGPLEVSCQYTAPCCDGILPPFGAIPLAGDDLAGLLSPDGPAEIQESPPAAETAQHSRQLRTEGVKASLTAAIRLGGRPIGIISLHDCEKRRLWTRSEIALLQSVVDHTAMAIKNARLFAETTRLASRQSLLSRVLQGMNKSNQIDDIF
ncbi:MAG TPA: GAF domain-containing protein, partial [Blastocatellia bacterium]|nr:GAF domain-containing protein [Blastocatellia bacterium]